MIRSIDEKLAQTIRERRHRQKLLTHATEMVVHHAGRLVWALNRWPNAPKPTQLLDTLRRTKPSFVSEEQFLLGLLSKVERFLSGGWNSAFILFSSDGCVVDTGWCSRRDS